MTAYVPSLDSLRAAHGEFVTTVLARSRQDDPAPLVNHLVAHNRWIAAQLRAIYHNPGDMPAREPATASDVPQLLAELAASCADVGDVVRNLPSRAQPCGEALVAAVIGQYSQQTARLRGGIGA